MKKRVYFLMIFLLALLLTGCSEKSGGSTQYQVYYISTSGTKLVEESYTPESSTSPREVTEELLEKMGRPQVGSDHVKALPDEVKVEHCVLKAREVDVDFNEAYNDMDPVREILVRAAFVNTLIQVSNVEQVVITVNDEDLVDEAGDVVGGMTAESFIDTKGDGINSYQNGTLSLYFADSDGSLIERDAKRPLFFQFHAGKGDPGRAHQRTGECEASGSSSGGNQGPLGPDGGGHLYGKL